MNTGNNPENLIAQLLTPVKLDHIPAIKYGMEMEDTAKDAYIATHRKHHKNLQVSEAGLHVSVGQPYIGVSPDGIVECECESCKRRSLENKCPFSVANEEPTTENVKYIITQADGSLTLQKSHQYYSQIQGQMGVAGFDSCDLFVFTAHGNLTVTVPFDEPYWAALSKNLKKFYWDHYCERFYEAQREEFSHLT
jgi:hypothetical protein